MHWRTGEIVKLETVDGNPQQNLDFELPNIKIPYKRLDTKTHSNYFQE